MSKVDVEIQLANIDREITRVQDILNSKPLIEQRLAKLQQRKNQLQLLVDIHTGKLRVYRTDNGERLPVKFWP